MLNICLTTHHTYDYQELADITIPIMQKYCLKHGYGFNIEIMPKDDFHFVKTRSAIELLEEYDIVVAIEADFLITNHTIKIEKFIDDDNDFYVTKDVNGFNTGCFIVKSNPFGKAKMNYIQKYKHIFGDEQNVLEQDGESHPFFQIGLKILQHPSINSIPYEYYAPSFGYINWEKHNPRKEKPTHEMGCWQKGDFCMHLPGMTLEKRCEIFTNHLSDIIYE